MSNRKGENARDCDIVTCHERRHPGNMHVLLRGSKVLYFCTADHLRRFKEEADGPRGRIRQGDGDQQTKEARRVEGD